MAVAAASLFPAVSPQEPYRVSIQAAQEEYTRHHNTCSQALETIKALTPVWKERHVQLKVGENNISDPLTLSKEAIKGEFDGKLQTYASFRDMRDEIIPKTIAACDRAIAALRHYTSWTGAATHYPLDAGTLAVLARAGAIDLDRVQAVYDQIFSTELADLENKRKTMDELGTNIQVHLPRLRKALEPLAQLAADNAMVPSLVDSTPNVNAAVQEVLAARKRAQEAGVATA